MRVTSKGQVTIPLEVREKLGIRPHSDVEFVIEGNLVYVRKVEGPMGHGAAIVERMRRKATIRMTTDEIMALTRGEE